MDVFASYALHSHYRAFHLRHGWQKDVAAVCGAPWETSAEPIRIDPPALSRLARGIIRCAFDEDWTAQLAYR